MFKANEIARGLLSCLLILSGSVFCPGRIVAQDSNQLARQRAETMLHQLPESIKSMDEPMLRVFLRYRIASFLWAKAIESEYAFAQVMATDALEDLSLHKSDIKDSALSYYGDKLLALLRTYSPALAAKLAEKYELNKSARGDFGIAYSMLGTKEGTSRAIEIVKQSLKDGQDGGLTLLFFLTNLRKEHPQEYFSLLKEIIITEMLKPGTFSIMSLYMLKSLYLIDETPLEMKLQFLGMVVNSVEKTCSQNNSDDIVTAYDLLRDVYGEIEKITLSDSHKELENLSAPMYARARAVMAMLTSRVPSKVIERRAVQARVENSSDPLRQLIVEADAATSDSDKDDLRTQAAHLALGKGEMRLAAELAAKTSAEGQHGMWRDQFLEEIIDAAIKKEDEELSRYALSKMKTPLNRASAMQKLALFFFDSKDTVRAREWMNDTVKLIESSDNEFEKARKLFEIVSAYKKIDDSRVSELIQSAIKSCNRISKPSQNEKADNDARKAYAESLTNVTWHAIPAFRLLFQQDEIGAYSIAGSIQQPEIKAAALWGITSGALESGKSSNPATK